MINYYPNEYYDDPVYQFGAAISCLNLQPLAPKILMTNNDPLLPQRDEQIKEELIDLPNCKHIEEWTPQDVLSWLFSETLTSNRVIIHDLNGHNFAHIDGKILLKMTKEEFNKLSPMHGAMLYQRLQNHHRLQNLRSDIDRSYYSDPYPQSFEPFGNYGELKFENNNSEKYSMGNLNDEINSSPWENNTKNSELSNSGLDSDSGFESELSIIPPVIKRKPGRPRGSRKKKNNEEKLGRLWEFIRDLLLNPQYCPSLICWDNHDEGTFRFVRSDKVAQLWGSKKKNDDMNYEKLSRAMRYYYKSKVLQPVLGRRLVYKFGPTATGWRTSNPNFIRRTSG